MNIITSKSKRINNNNDSIESVIKINKRQDGKEYQDEDESFETN